MRSKFTLSAVAPAAFFAAALMAHVPVSGAETSLTDLLAEGRGKFEALCGSCHNLEKPLGARLDRAQWEDVLAEMEKKGAKVSPGEKRAIVEYLTVRLTFDAKCTVCHTRERVFDRERKFVDWKRTVSAMAQKQPELISDAEAGRIIAYLNLVLGASPSYLPEEGK